MKSAMWNSRVDDSNGSHGYDIILGRDILSELNIYLYLSGNSIWESEGTCKVCTVPIKYLSKIHFNSSYDWLKDKSFWKKELW